MSTSHIGPLAEPTADLLPVRRAILSVSDKSRLVDFARGLADHGVTLVSTGGTAKALADAGLTVVPIEQVTGFPEILDGRVKTLHPKVHGGLLGRPDIPEHQREMRQHGIEPIDLVCVNLYPFARTVAQSDVTWAEAVENIDIGGPSMVRSAAKNFAFVAVVTDPGQYDQVLSEMRANGGRLSLATRRRLAEAAFELTSRYDGAIADYFRDRLVPTGGSGAMPQTSTPGPCPPALTVQLERVRLLRYGENPHQAAGLYRVVSGLAGAEPACRGEARLLAGKDISFNNYVDADAAVELVREFVEPAAVIIKHTNPSGAAVHDDIVEAYRRAYLGDVNAAMGGIVAFNRPVTVPLAEAVMDSFARWGKSAGAGGFFVEVLVGPEFEPAALEVVRTARKWGQNVRVLATGPLGPSSDRGLLLKSLTSGVLVQQRDFLGLDEEQWRVVTGNRPTDRQMADLRFAWLCCKHVKSNAIVLARDRTLLGSGAGQMSRVTSSRLACELARASAASGGDLSGGVLASDAFFPFRDGVDAAAGVGVSAVVQPGGSKKDDEVIAAADEHGIAMVFTGTRHFRH